jgi:hypothetical protein
VASEQKLKPETSIRSVFFSSFSKSSEREGETLHVH